jgi:hypothetical protein
VKKLLAFILTFGLVCALGLSTVGCSKKEDEKKDKGGTTPAADKKDKT